MLSQGDVTKRVGVFCKKGYKMNRTKSNKAINLIV